MKTNQSVSRLLAIGDIHGCYREFCELLDQMKPELSVDYLVIVGDLIDRGPDSCEVVQKVRQMQSSGEPGHVIVLRGNHERMDFSLSMPASIRCCRWKNR